MHERESETDNGFRGAQEEESDNIRTLLSKGKWNEKEMSQKQQERSFQKLAELALAEGTALYLSIDDTVIEKKKPSLKAKRPIEGTGWHY